MSTFEPKKVQELLDAGNVAEAKAYVERFARRDMTEEEKAAIHFEYMALYMKVTNLAKEQRNAALRSALKDLKVIDSAEKQAAHDLKVAKVRADLASKAGK